MPTQNLHKLAVFCLASAALSIGAVTTATSAIAGPIYRWELNSQFDSYFLSPNSVNPSPTYKLVIDVAGYTADDDANLFNNVDISPLATSMTYFKVDGPSGFTSHTDAEFNPIANNWFFANWGSGPDNTLSSLNISSIGLSIWRKGNNLFDLNLFGFGLNSPLPSIILASDTDVSFNQKDLTSTPEPSTLLGLLGLAAFTFKALKKTSSHSGLE